MTVLVATAERHIARLCEVSLSRQGWSVHCALNSKQAREFIHSRAPDLLVLDSRMERQSALAQEAASLGIKVMELSE